MAPLRGEGEGGWGGLAERALLAFDQQSIYSYKECLSLWYVE